VNEAEMVMDTEQGEAEAYVIHSPVTGTVYPLSDVNDPAFSKGLMGKRKTQFLAVQDEIVFTGKRRGAGLYLKPSMRLAYAVKKVWKFLISCRH
jgi:hypothetical protein